MFERLTKRARKVVVLAQEEARSFGHAYIGTEHLLLGLLREDEGAAAQALVRLNVTVSRAREQVESIVGRGEDRDITQAPFTPRSKKVLELALREALQLGHNYIGTEHILLGLVRESEGVAARVLSNLDVGADEVREQVIRLLGGEPARGGRWAARPGPQNFRGRMDFEVQARCVDRRRQGPQPVLLRLAYSYQAQHEVDTFSEAVDHGKLRRGVARVFEDEAFPFLEPGIARAEGYIKDEHEAIQEAEISVTIQGGLELPVARTFKR